MVNNLPAMQETACNAADMGSVPGLARSSGEGNGKTLQYSCLENTMNRGAWWATVHGVTRNQTRLSITQQQQGGSKALSPMARYKLNPASNDKRDLAAHYFSNKSSD